MATPHLRASKRPAKPPVRGVKILHDHPKAPPSTRKRNFAPNVSLNTYKMPMETKPRAHSKVFRQTKPEAALRRQSLDRLLKIAADRLMKKHMPLPSRKLPKKLRPTHESFKKLHVNLKSVDVDEASVERMIDQQRSVPMFAAQIQIGSPLESRVKNLRALGFGWSVVQSQIATEFVTGPLQDATAQAKKEKLELIKKAIEVIKEQEKLPVPQSPAWGSLTTAK